jgi:hypothetical protein
VSLGTPDGFARQAARLMQPLGWLCKLRLTSSSEFDTLLNAEAYKAHCEGESEEH